MIINQTKIGETLQVYATSCLANSLDARHEQSKNIYHVQGNLGPLNQMNTPLYVYPQPLQNFIPTTPGIYFLSDGNKIYCGSSSNLRTRVKSSKRKNNITGDILVYPIYTLDDAEAVSSSDILHLEDTCISSLLTIIYGNGLPLELLNFRSALLLPPSAWIDEKHLVKTGSHQGYSLGTTLAQMALIHFGIPHIIAGLPAEHYYTIVSPMAKRNFNVANWSYIVNDYIEKGVYKSVPEHLRGLVYMDQFIASIAPNINAQP